MNRATGKRIVNSHAEVDACSVTFPRGDIQSGKLSQEPRLVDVRSLRGESVVGCTAKQTQFWTCVSIVIVRTYVRPLISGKYHPLLASILIFSLVHHAITFCYVTGKKRLNERKRGRKKEGKRDRKRKSEREKKREI